MVNDLQFGKIGILVEEMLDPLKYKKWNNNCGFVDGQTICSIVNNNTDTIAECSDEDDGSTHDAFSGSLPCILDSDIPQAFSHFTYRHTNRKCLVCDLQGV